MLPRIKMKSNQNSVVVIYLEFISAKVKALFQHSNLINESICKIVWFT